MRIMQVNSFPIRQNRMAFKSGEAKPAEKAAEKPLLQKLDELQERFAHGGTIEEAEKEYEIMVSKSIAELSPGKETEDGAKALLQSSEKLAHIYLTGLSSTNRIATIDKLGRLGKIIDAVIFQTRGELIKENPIHILRHQFFRT